MSFAVVTDNITRLCYTGMDKKRTDSVLKEYSYLTQAFDAQRPLSLSINEAFHLRIIFVGSAVVVLIEGELILPLKSHGLALHTFDSQRSLSLSIDESFHPRTIFVESDGVIWIRRGLILPLKSHGHISDTFDSQQLVFLSIDKAFHLRTIFIDSDGVIWIRRGLVLLLNPYIDRRGTDSALKSHGHALHTFDFQRSLSLSVDEAFYLRTIFVDSAVVVLK